MDHTWRTRTSRIRLVLMAATTATALSVTGCSASLAEIIPTGSAGSLGSTGATEQPGTNAAAALATLETIPVKGRAPKTGYSRDQFGQAWTDDVTVEFGHNGCDTRIICTQGSVQKTV